jgi:hypothetical protein
MFSNVCLITSFTLLLGKPSLAGITKNITPQNFKVFFPYTQGQRKREREMSVPKVVVGL